MGNSLRHLRSSSIDDFREPAASPRSRLMEGIMRQRPLWSKPYGLREQGEIRGTGAGRPVSGNIWHVFGEWLRVKNFAILNEQGTGLHPAVRERYRRPR